MAEYHVGCLPTGIYAGTIKDCMWKSKSEVTEEAIIAVRDYMKQELLTDGTKTSGYEWDMPDGSIMQLLVSVKEGA